MLPRYLVMLYLLSALLTGPILDASSSINTAIAAHANLKAFRVHIVLDAQLKGSWRHETFDIATDGKTALIRLRKPEIGDEAASDRSFYFGVSNLVAYDAAADERLTRPLPKSKDLLGRYLYLFGPPDDMVKNQLQPQAMQDFLVSMRKLSGWHSKRGPFGPEVVSRRGDGETDLQFDSTSGLLRRLDVKTGKDVIHWQFDYASGRPAPLVIPKSARLVSSFTVAQVPPAYDGPKAKQLADQMIAAYRRLTRGEIIVDGEDGHVEIYISDRKIRENQPTLSYGYDGSRLEILGGKSNAYYAGKAVRRVVPEYVGLVGGRVDPISRQILQRKVPFQEVLAPRVKVSYAGQMSVGTATNEMLKVEIPGGRVSLFVRSQDHLLDAAMTETLDDKGHVIARSARRFKYDQIGEAQPDYRFVVAKRMGQKTLPLPAIKLSP